MTVAATKEGVDELRRGALRARAVLLAMVVVATSAALVSMVLLYRAGLNAQRERLQELAYSQAELINAVARFDATESRDANPAGAWVATLGQVAEGYSQRRQDKEHVSFAIIGRQAGKIVLHVENGKLHAPRSGALPAGYSAQIAEASLTHERGAEEYRSQGRSWLVVHERIAALDMAVLVRLDLDGIRRPFRLALWISGLATLILIGLGSALLRKTNVRTVQDLARQLTLRKRAERELQRHRDDLERTVELRSAELARAQSALVERARLATLGQITAKVSHELRNPLGTLRTSLFTLRARTRGSELGLERVLDRCERNVVRCDRIIEELLIFTRPRSPQRKKVNISELLRDVIDEYPLPPPLTIALSLESQVELMIDAEDLRRMLINLLSNAADATVEHGSAQAIEVTLKREGDWVVIHVADHGGGVSDDVLSKAFEPLFSTKGFGIGLGLPIVRELAERNGGRVELASREREGATTTLFFPSVERVVS